MARFVRWLGFTLALAAGYGCDRARLRPAGADEPVGVVDSVQPRGETLAEFRRDMDSVDALAAVATSREDLVRQFVRALEEQDTTTLRRLHITPAEFGWLYYPDNPQGLPPYDLSASLMWFTLQGSSGQGLSGLLKNRAGKELGYRKTICPADSSNQGENAVYGPCVVERVTASGDTVRERLFGLIMERNGRWKFVSYADKYRE